ncbi:MAG: hypothetical protein HYX71_12705 [Opitutae bacterium]|nr:hypothetical protein [Opitutae bacterium]
MIPSASSSPGSSRADALAAAAASAAAARAPRPPADRLRIDQATALRTSLSRLPEVRPEVVARAKFLASDPGYPSDRIIRQVSAALVNSPDLSEDSP